MNQINPALPAVGSDLGIWGQKLNDALSALVDQGNAADTAIKTKLTVPTGGTAGQVLIKTASAYGWADASSSGLTVTDNGDSVTISGPGVADNGDYATITY